MPDTRESAPSNSSLSTLTGAILRIRTWENTTLPLQDSSIAFNMLMLVAHRAFIGNPITLKELYLSLNHSEQGIRKHLRRCAESRWLLILRTSNDRRVRIILPDNKLIRAMPDYFQLIQKELINNLENNHKWKS